MTARERNRIKGAAGEPSGIVSRAATLTICLSCLALTLAAPARAQTGVSESQPLALSLPEIGAERGKALPPGPETARLKDALEQMSVENPVVARVDGHEIRWAEVVASAADLPPRYRDQIESVFPALLDRLVDLRLLAEAAREQGLRDDPVVRKRMAAYEDQVLSGALLERHLDKQVSTADLRKRYDILVASRRRDSEVRARHIVVEDEATAQAIIGKLDGGAVFISLATEYSTGASAGRGGDLGYFQPSRMDPAFTEAVVDLEPGEYTREPVETDFGWHVILLVDRRSDDIPSFLDMQPRLREEARKEAVDRLVLSLRSQAELEMFPEDALESDTAGETSAGAGDAQ